MNSKDYRLSQMKHRLLQMRGAGKKNPRLKLSITQREYLMNVGFPIKPYLYEIKTKPINNVKNQCGLIKDIHYSFLKHKHTIYRPLSDRKAKLLEDMGISIKVFKYEVLLNQYQS